MITQLRLDLTPRPPANTEPVFDLRNWLDVSTIAAGVGFDQPVFVSVTLSDVFKAGQCEAEENTTSACMTPCGMPISNGRSTMGDLFTLLSPSHTNSRKPKLLMKPACACM